MLGQSLSLLPFDWHSLPQKLLAQWRQELDHGKIKDVDFRRRIELYLDQGYGSCFLKDQRVARMVQENLIHFEGIKYKLHAWVVMPNHVHYLATPETGYSPSEIVHSCKSFTAHEANRILDRNGRFWFPEPFDQYIRNHDHFVKTIRYIERNPVKAGLCKKASDWRFSSAYLPANLKS
jgi:REP element-mobilizing transposase RayT